MGHHHSKTWNHHWIPCNLSQPCLFTQLSQCKNRFWSLMSLHISWFFLYTGEIWSISGVHRQVNYFSCDWPLTLTQSNCHPQQDGEGCVWLCVSGCIWYRFNMIVIIDPLYGGRGPCVCNKTLLLTSPRNNQLLIRTMKTCRGFLHNILTMF